MKKTICWITATYFLDVDLPVVPSLQCVYDIDWIIITTKSNVESDESMINKRGCKNYRLLVLDSNFVSIKTFYFYKDLLLNIRNIGYDLFYLDISGMPYFYILVKYYLPVDKCIVAAHNVATPKGARYYYLAKLYMDYVVHVFNKFQVFSKNQFDLLHSINNSARILYAPLCLKDYGEPTVRKPLSPITFLFFGNIVEYKRLDILLEATKILEVKGVSNFKVQICGYCARSKWNRIYKEKADRCKNVFVDIRRIPSGLVPNYFEQSHYFVMPYQDIAQSGAMTVAFFYNIPIIASELNTFKEFLNDGLDGFFFEIGNPYSLAEKMEYVILNHNNIYNDLRVNQDKLVQVKLSKESIIKQYVDYIKKVCPN